MECVFLKASKKKRVVHKILVMVPPFTCWFKTHCYKNHSLKQTWMQQPNFSLSSVQPTHIHNCQMCTRKGLHIVQYTHIGVGRLNISQAVHMFQILPPCYWHAFIKKRRRTHRADCCGSHAHHLGSGKRKKKDKDSETLKPDFKHWPFHILGFSVSTMM